MVNVLIGLGFSALVLISVGLANDLTSGNRSLEIKVNERSVHTQPIFTFCPVGSSEGTLPNISYCSWNRELTIRSGQLGMIGVFCKSFLRIICGTADRDWGEATEDCPREMAAAGINIWRVHPVDPTCWILMNDTANRLIPAGRTENMYLYFEADGIGMRVWNNSGKKKNIFRKIVTVIHAFV